jgi:hypothetical protein
MNGNSKNWEGGILTLEDKELMVYLLLIIIVAARVIEWVILRERK